MAELCEIDKSQLNSAGTMRMLLEAAIVECGATVCGYAEKRFEPEGLTMVFLLEESHAAIHTYPERGALFLDIFTCGKCEPMLALNYLSRELKAEAKNVRVLARAA